MKNPLLAIIVLSLGLVCQLRAGLYDFTFTQSLGGPTTATGQIDVVGGFAVSGYLNVTGGFGTGLYNFVVASGTANGTTGAGTTLYESPENLFLTDGAVFAAANPFLTEGGLLFSSGGTEFNLYYFNSSFRLTGASRDAAGTPVYRPNARGTATLTAVPETGATLAMLGAALISFVAFRRRFAG